MGCECTEEIHIENQANVDGKRPVRIGHIKSYDRYEEGTVIEYSLFKRTSKTNGGSKKQRS